jgi:hypothetical protein
MTEPAKDEAELLDQVVVATCECHPGECYVKMGQMLCCAEEDKVEAVFAAISAAGWAVVPASLTLPAYAVPILHENARLREALKTLLETADKCKTMEIGAGGMSIEAQAARPGQIPLVVARGDRREAVVILRLDDFLPMLGKEKNNV